MTGTLIDLSNLVLSSTAARDSRFKLIDAAVWFCLRTTCTEPIFEDGQIGIDDQGDYAADW